MICQLFKEMLTTTLLLHFQIVALAALIQFQLVTLDGMEIPMWAHGIGIGLLIVAVLPIFVYMIYIVLIQLEYGILGVSSFLSECE